jgi:hypothetical protein
LTVAEGFITKVPPYYERDGVTLYHGDCLDMLPTLSGIDAVVTDPPYGIAHSSNWASSWQGTNIRGDEDTALRDWIVSWGTALTAPWAVFGSWKRRHPKGTRATLIWDKGPASGMGDLAFPWKPSFELIHVGGRGWKGRRDEGVLKGHVELTWETRGRRHPHQKPVSLMAHLLGKLPEDGAVADPFAGTGSTLVAAVMLGRRAVGIEIEERYCEVAARRLEKAVVARRSLEFSCAALFGDEQQP